MERMEVESNYITSIWYDEHDSVLEIAFISGHIYEYLEVPVEEFEEIMDADSHGEYFHEYVKDVYKYNKIK